MESLQYNFTLQLQPFISWTDKKPQNFMFFGVSTYESEGQWIIIGKHLV